MTSRSETPPLAVDAPEFRPYRLGCDRCPMIQICQRRVRINPAAWVMCEIPDEADLIVADLTGFPYVIKENDTNGKTRATI